MVIRSAPGQKPQLDELHRRVRWLVIVVSGAFLLLVGRLWQLQVVRGERYHEGVISNVVDERFLPSVRGKILDRDGEALVDNRPAFNIYVTPGRFVDGDLDRLTRLLGLHDDERETVREAIEVGRRRDRNRAMLVLEDQGRDRAALVAQARLELPGVQVHDEPYRRYVHGDLAAHVLGYMNHLTQQELSEYGPQGYEASEFIGRYGIEKQWEHYLRGKKGIERYVVDATGQRVDDGGGGALIEGDRFVPPAPGHNVVLTLDLELQKRAEEAVSQHAAAAAVVVEARTGRILAMVSKPSFDPNVMTGHLTRAEYQLLLSDPRKPFIDKVLRQHYPPGSTFKPVTMIAALEDGVLGPHEQLLCRGWHERGNTKFRCPGQPHKTIDITEALQHSCNVFVWMLSEQVGLDRIAEVARDLGFGTPTGIGLNGDVPGVIPTRQWYERSGRGGFKIGYTLNSATGQGDVQVTVLQLALAYASIANGGTLYAPQIVQRIENAGGEVVADYAPTARRRIDASPSHLALLRRGMWKVVNEEKGTGHRAVSEVIEFAGKTGSAQVYGRRRHKQAPDRPGWHPYREHAWFAGYAPADNPEIVVAVLIEHGGAGGQVAAPVAKEIIEAYFTEVRP